MASGREALGARIATASGRPEQWRTVAPGWARQRAFVWEVAHHVGDLMVDTLEPQPGETILELAAGMGDTGFEAARRVGPSGRVISTDVAPEMVDAARANAAADGLANVETRVVDAQAIDLADGSVDGVLCRWGYMLVPDPSLALAETHRVLRAGGRVVFSVWAEASANVWATAVGRALVDLGLLDPPDPDAPGPFRLGDADRVRGLVESAGFGAPTVEDVPLTWRYPSLDDYWSVTGDLSFLVASAVESLAPDELAAVRAWVEADLRPYAESSGALTVPGLCRIFRAAR